MTPASPIRTIYQGVADRRQMFRLFDRHAHRPNRFEDDAGPLYRGEWFEVSAPDHDYMFNVLPPLFMRDGMFAMREFLTDRITSVFYELNIDGHVRYFHAYCDLAEKGSADRMRTVIIERESRPVRAMTREERIEHIWSSTHDEYRGYAGERWPQEHRGKRTVLYWGGRRGTVLKLLETFTDTEIAAKLPVHLRHLPPAVAA